MWLFKKRDEFWGKNWIKLSDLGPEFEVAFPKMRAVCIGTCGAEGIHFDSFVMNPYSIAHTHRCNCSYNNLVCVKKKSYLRNHEGEISEVMWHEYAHVLDPTKYKFSQNCIPEANAFDDGGHNRKWRKIMRDFGFIPSPYCRESLVEENNDFIQDSTRFFAGTTTSFPWTDTTQSYEQGTFSWSNNLYNWPKKDLGQFIYSSKEP